LLAAAFFKPYPQLVQAELLDAVAQSQAHGFCLDPRGDMTTVYFHGPEAALAYEPLEYLLAAHLGVVPLDVDQ
jgi:hypothetical protein